jgi:lambda family phage portal protein
MFEKIKGIIARWFGGAKQIAKRRYNSAKVDRTTSDWLPSSQTTNMQLRYDLKRLRERSRDMAKNDPYAKKYFRLVKSNVIGKGITLQVKTSDKTLKSDAVLTSKIEAKFREWGKKKNCTLSGKLSWLGVQQLFVTHLARDGEVVLRVVSTSKNKFGIGLKFYSPQWLDEMYNDTLPGGNRVIMSVEVDDDDMPVAYWLTQPAGEYQRRNTTRYRTRVPASEIIHRFLINEDEDQARGVPWLHASMLRLKNLDGYEEAEIIAARIEACQMGFAIPPKDEISEHNAEDDDGNEIQIEESVEPGVIRELPAGYDFKTFDPKHPNANAEGFKKGTLRGVAAGAEISYHTLVGDLEAVNYSSAKIGSLDDRDVWTDLQEFTIEALCEPVYEKWLESAFLNGVLDISLKDYERIKEPTFRARGWTWVEPFKEAQAHVIGLQYKMESLTDILAERGIDIQDFFATIKKERELAKDYDIDLDELFKPKETHKKEESGQKN